MSMRRWLAEAFRDFNAAVGLTAAHDYDLLDEPSAPATASPWPPQLADTSTQRPSGGTAGLRSVDGPTALGGTAGAVGHPQTSVVSELRAHNSADRPAPSSTTIASGHGTPQSICAGHPSQYPLTDVEAAAPNGSTPSAPCWPGSATPAPTSSSTSNASTPPRPGSPGPPQ
ncbi:hypothetical protein [Mycolicibacter algericus]|uniref:hypothetical protein n=1 Tax=Mycolicibacter algericus TaxID=1288388 RepID=UPI0013D011AC|nr:hypothetical protein [Mycolicibacter algericus]